MKEELLSILISDGWGTDENDALVEVAIPSTVETYQAPTKVTFLGETLNYIPSTVAALQEFVASNMVDSVIELYSYTNLTSVSLPKLKSICAPRCFTGLTRLTTVNLPELLTISNSSGSNGAFRGCTALQQISLPKLKTISMHNGGYDTRANPPGIFVNCSNLTTIDMPELETIEGTSDDLRYLGAFSNCTSLTSVSLPKLKTINKNNTFKGCTTLSHVDLPSLELINYGSGSLASGGCFSGCPLTYIELPKLKNIIGGSYGGVFVDCLNLESVTLGSAGHPVEALGVNTFSGCTQSNLTITIYTADGNALANSPFGATNATIIYKTA